MNNQEMITKNMYDTVSAWTVIKFVASLFAITFVGVQVDEAMGTGLNDNRFFTVIAITAYIPYLVFSMMKVKSRDENLENINAALYGEVVELQNKMGEVAKFAEQAAKDNKTLQERLQSYESDLLRNKKVIQSNDETIQGYQKEVAEQKEKIAKLNGDILDFKQRISEVRKEGEQALTDYKESIAGDLKELAERREKAAKLSEKMRQNAAKRHTKKKV